MAHGFDRYRKTVFAASAFAAPLALPSAGFAQSGPPATVQVSPPTARPSSASPVPRQAGDITVEGITVPGAEAADHRVAQGATGRTSGIDASQSIIANRRKYEWSDMYVRCTIASGRLRKERLRAAVDGEYNQPRHAYAQDLLARGNPSCTQHAFQTHFTEPPELGYSIYDRGAFLIEAIRTYAPDLKLTRRETHDPVVQSRFNLREVPRNRFRLPVDYRYFETAVCAVRLQPTLSAALVRTPYAETKKVNRIESAIVDGSRICFGNAKKVFFDPTQFRIYIADAVYRWAVAARGVDSLIPLE
jgi:hypothetical protein